MMTSAADAFAGEADSRAGSGLTLDAGEAAGRRLNFLMQEMNREANTIGSKSASSEISILAVQLKEELERIREQVQNIE